MGLGQFTGNHNRLVADLVLKLLEGRSKTMRCFEEYDRSPGTRETVEPLLTVFRPSRRESEKCKRLSCDPRGGQRGHDRARTRDGFDPDLRGDRLLDEFEAWIGNRRGSRVGHECDALALEQPRDERFALRPLVVLVKAGGRRCYC